MPCMWCDQLGYWECGYEPPPLCEPGVTPGYKVGWDWIDSGTVELEEGQTYYLKCRPGGSCEALVEVDPAEPPHPWKIVGEVSVPTPNLPAGVYAVYCRTGHGDRCYVRLHPVEEET